MKQNLIIEKLIKKMSKFTDGQIVMIMNAVSNEALNRPKLAAVLEDDTVKDDIEYKTLKEDL